MRKKKETEKKNNDWNIDCFAYNPQLYSGCGALLGVKVPKDCVRCRFKKPKKQYEEEQRKYRNGGIYGIR